MSQDEEDTNRGLAVKAMSIRLGEAISTMFVEHEQAMPGAWVLVTSTVNACGCTPTYCLTSDGITATELLGLLTTALTNEKATLYAERVKEALEQ